MTARAVQIPYRLRGHYLHLVPLDQLKSAVERYVQAAPRILHTLARQLGYSEAAVRARLLELEEDQRVHRVCVLAARGAGGRHWEWRAGPAPLPKIDEAVGTGEIPCQTRARHYPRVDRRDDLVAALFGPANRTREAT